MQIARKRRQRKKCRVSTESTNKVLIEDHYPETVCDPDEDNCQEMPSDDLDDQLAVKQQEATKYKAMAKTYWKDGDMNVMKEKNFLFNKERKNFG